MRSPAFALAVGSLDEDGIIVVAMAGGHNRCKTDHNRNGAEVESTMHWARNFREGVCQLDRRLALSRIPRLRSMCHSQLFPKARPGGNATGTTLPDKGELHT